MERCGLGSGAQIEVWDGKEGCLFLMDGWEKRNRQGTKFEAERRGMRDFTSSV